MPHLRIVVKNMLPSSAQIYEGFSSPILSDGIGKLCQQTLVYEETANGMKHLIPWPNVEEPVGFIATVK